MKTFINVSLIILCLVAIIALACALWEVFSREVAIKICATALLLAIGIVTWRDMREEK
jgi:hypothetical protein